MQTLFSPGIVLTNIIGDLESEEKGVHGMTMKEVSFLEHQDYSVNWKRKHHEIDQCIFTNFSLTLFNLFYFAGLYNGWPNTSSEQETSDS